jgi:hypothetical protein
MGTHLRSIFYDGSYMGSGLTSLRPGQIVLTSAHVKVIASARLTASQETVLADGNWQKWLKRVGFAGFMFFLLKGIAWLVVLYFGVTLF